MAFLSQFLPWAMLATSATAIKDNPGAHGPPPGSDPLSWGFYATPEVEEPTQLEIQGTIPPWITGSLYRGAASTWDVGNYTAEHWFDGFTRNHRFEIADGQVTYRSRNASDELTAFVQETGLYPGGSFGGDPCKVIFGAFESTFRDGKHPQGDPDSVDVGVAYIPNFPGLARNSTNTGAPFDTLMSTTDANSLQQIDPVTLNPIEGVTYQASHPLLGGLISAAHPAMSQDGAIYNYALDPRAEEPVYRVFGLYPPEGETKILANITDAPAAYIHSLFHTKKHLILIIWQADYKKESTNVIDSIGEWDPNRKSIFYVIDPVNGGVLRKYESADAFFAFHEVNSFENEAGDIFVDLARMKDTSFLQAGKIENLRHNLGKANESSREDLNSQFARYRLPFHDSKNNNSTGCSNGYTPTFDAELEFTLPLAEANIELPRINSDNMGKQYRFAYGIHADQAGNFADSIIKIDTKNKHWKVWTPETRHFPSEPIFIQRPGATCEDDGAILFVAMDAEARTSALVVLDAQSLEEVARARMPIVMSYGFHGTWGQA